MKIISTFFIAFILLAAFFITAQQQGGPLDDLRLFGYQPKANSNQIVMGGSTARFTVLTPYVIRMEYSASGAFEDRATLAVVNRATAPAPSFTQSTNGNTLTIATPYVTLTYQLGQSFSSSSLKVSSNDGVFGQYSFGDKDTGNLLGTIRSLDDHCTIPLNCDQNAGMQTNGEDLHCAWGVISQLGWTTIDDTRNFIMAQGAGTWFNNNAASRSSSDVDTYFFGHGLNFKQGLKDWVHIGGKVPIPSRPLLGSWFTRWFDYDHSDVQRLLDIFRKEGLPLDVLILDMNWHQKNQWTGWTWDHQLFPFPNATLEMIRKRGLMTAGNIHDEQGVSDFEQRYAEFAAAMGYPPNTNTPFLFSPLNATYMRAVEDVLLGPQGANFDFYWTDWQQGGTNGGCNGFQLNPTYITDHVRWSDNMRRGVNKRSNNFARFGGLGAHRYPVGFTGDVLSLSWQCFSYQPYFSVTASNVGYGYPSHDLVGPPNDHELHVRWMQFGAFSGIMRIHDRGMSSGVCWDADLCAVVDIWTLPFEYFDAIRDAMYARVALLPYIYREARKAYDTGLNLVHGLYIDFPSFSQAYQLSGTPGSCAQYMFGEDIMVAIITQAADPNVNLVTVSNIWVPPGTWYDNVFGVLVTGPSTIGSRQYTLADIPMFIRAGAIVPRIPHAEKQGKAAEQFTEVDWYIYPGASSGSNSLYEDDGQTWDYISGGYVFSNCSYQRSGSSSSAITVTVGAPIGGGGTFNFPKSRRTRFFLVSMSPVASAKCGGTPVSFNQDGGANTWYYDGFNGQVVVDCGDVSTGAGSFVMSASFVVGGQDGKSVSGAKGYASRAQLAKRILDNRQQTPGSHDPKQGFTKLAGSHAAYLAGLAPTASPSSWNSATGSNYQTVIQNAINELNSGSEPLPTNGPMTALVQIYDDQRGDFALCGSKDCLTTNSYYRAMWLEGFQPSPGDGSAVQLYDYWSWTATDNWATTNASAPNSGYSAAAFSNGFVLNQQRSGQTSPVCLQTWVNGNDHFTFASNQSLTYAQQNGYTQVGGCIGYVLSQPITSTSSNDVVSALAALHKERGHDAVITAQDLLDRMEGKQSSIAKKQSQEQPPAVLSNVHGHPIRKNAKKTQPKNRQQLAGAKLMEDSAVQRAIALLQSSMI